MILLTGATGTIGQETVRQLLAKGVPFRAMVRDVERATALLGPDVELVTGDFAAPETLDRAFAGVTRLSLLCATVESIVELELAAVAAARRAGIGHIVKMSAIASAPDAPTVIRRCHGRIEKRIEDQGFAFTHLWPNAFMHNFRRFAPGIKRDGVFYAPIGDARISLVDIHDVAAVTVAALTEEGHEGKTYEITGPEAISYAACARHLSRALGTTVRYDSVTPEAAGQALRDAGLGPWLTEALLEIDALFRTGFGAPVTDVVERVTRRKARDFAAFARAHLALFRAGT